MKTLCWLFFLVALAVPVAAQERYEVRLHRPGKVGDRMEVAIRLATKSQRSFTQEGEEEKPRDNELALKLSGELEVLGLTPKGWWKELQFVIREIELIEDGRRVDDLKAGDVLRIRKGLWSDDIRVNGEKSTDRLVKAIIYWCLPVASDSTGTMDEAFGTLEKKALGDAWDGDPEKVLNQYGDSVIGLEAKEVTGKTKLVEKCTVGGKPGLRFVCDVNWDSPTARYIGTPFGVLPKRYLLHHQVELDLPIDASLNVSRTRITADAEEVSAIGQALSKSKNQFVQEVTVRPIP